MRDESCRTPPQLRVVVASLLTVSRFVVLPFYRFDRFEGFRFGSPQDEFPSGIIR
jgi:hypothetical protein